MESLDDAFRPPPPEREIFCNRTLNLRAVSAIGCDMDYTLVHYDSEEWERRSYEHVRRALLDRGWPVEDLRFDPELFTLGLIVDAEQGNVVKANRFGFVKRASHGTRMLDFEAQRAAYSRVQIDLADRRWRFINTLFSLSEVCLFAQLVDLLDAGKLTEPTGYGGLYEAVRAELDEAHMLGELKRDVAKSPDELVELDEELPLALLDLKHSGKKLLLITNSEWSYTRSMMAHAFDRFLPGESKWRDLFDLVVVAARKPDFFTGSAPAFEVVDYEGMLAPVVGSLRAGGVYVGGNARLVEDLLGCPGDQILYVGDHVFADVQVTKAMLRWRTALVNRALEHEISEIVDFRGRQRSLEALMAEKTRLERGHSRLRLEVQRADVGYGPGGVAPKGKLKAKMQDIRGDLDAIDGKIAPLARQASALGNERWGLMMRAGNDKSHLARQVERYADIYTSRVSNLLLQTPFVYLRSPYGSLPHDPPEGGRA